MSMQVTPLITDRNKFAERAAVALTIYLCFSYILRSFGLRNREGWIILGAYWVYTTWKYRGTLRFTKERSIYCWIGFVSLFFFLLPIANNTAKNIQSLIIDIFFCVLYLLSARIDKKNFKTVINIFIRAGLFLAFYITFCSLFPGIYKSLIAPHLAKEEMTDVINSYDRGYGASIGSSTVYASYIICVGVFFCFADLLFGARYRKKAVNIAYLIIFFLGLFCTGRRGTPLGLAMAMLIVYLITTPQDVRKILKRAGLLLVILLVFVALITILVRKGYLTRFVNTIELLLKSNIDLNLINRLSSSRLFLWIEAWELFKSSPIIGVGWGSFSLHVHTTVTNVHNCWLQFLCETGVIGFICIGFSIIALYFHSRSILKRAIKAPANDIKKYAMFVATGVQIYLLVMITIEPVFYKDYYHLLLVIMIMFVEFAKEMEKNKHEQSS